MAIQKVYWRYKTHINHIIKSIIESEYLWANENMSFLPKYFNSWWDNINSFSGNKSWYSGLFFILLSLSEYLPFFLCDLCKNPNYLNFIFDIKYLICDEKSYVPFTVTKIAKHPINAKNKGNGFTDIFNTARQEIYVNKVT